jgi:hypothetical protein
MAAEVVTESETGRARADTRFFTLRPLHIDLGDVVVQVVAVALGVILGLGATAWTERLHEQALFHETVGNIVSELRSNQQGLHVVIPLHTKLATELSALVKRAAPRASLSREQLGAVFRRRQFPENIPLGIAWQIAQNDRGLALLPYGDRYELAWIYQLQTFFVGNEQRFTDTLFSPQEPAAGNYYVAAESLTNQLDQLVGTEHQLDDLYTKALETARRQYGQ